MPPTLNHTLNLTESVNKCKCEIKMHLLHKPCHFSFYKSLSSLIVTCVLWDSYLNAPHHKWSAIASYQASLLHQKKPKKTYIWRWCWCKRLIKLIYKSCYGRSVCCKIVRFNWKLRWSVCFGTFLQKCWWRHFFQLVYVVIFFQEMYRDHAVLRI